jgi:hypothetical protein
VSSATMLSKTGGFSFSGCSMLDCLAQWNVVLWTRCYARAQKREADRNGAGGQTPALPTCMHAFRRESHPRDRQSTSTCLFRTLEHVVARVGPVERSRSLSMLISQSIGGRAKLRVRCSTRRWPIILHAWEACASPTMKVAQGCCILPSPSTAEDCEHCLFVSGSFWCLFHQASGAFLSA